MDFQAHQTAIIDKGAQIGAGTKVWHWVHISANAIIGENVTLGQNVFVGNKVKIDDNCKIQNNVSIYDGVYLEEAVFCGPSVVFTNVYNPRSLINRKDEYRPTNVKRGATLGANSTILCGLTIGEFSFIGAGSTVLKDVPAFALVVGSPAKQIGWVGEYGEKLDLPLSGNMELVCKNTNQKYKLTGDTLYRVF
ncbi:acyltransferase [Pseudothioglobus sp. nBUS_23]|uniref:acyltransferase n=1 Tax=Pseudothioglobus sp. nBUS_23 TaxID=3395318 RepID=UPI003EBC89E6